MDPTTKWLISSELAVLPTILQEDEIVEKIIRGHLKGNGILLQPAKVVVDQQEVNILKLKFPFNKIFRKCSTGLSIWQIENILIFQKLVISKIQAMRHKTLSVISLKKLQ